MLMQVKPQGRAQQLAQQLRAFSAAAAGWMGLSHAASQVCSSAEAMASPALKQPTCQVVTKLSRCRTTSTMPHSLKNADASNAAPAWPC